MGAAGARSVRGRGEDPTEGPCGTRDESRELTRQTRRRDMRTFPRDAPGISGEGTALAPTERSSLSLRVSACEEAAG